MSEDIESHEPTPRYYGNSLLEYLKSLPLKDRVKKIDPSSKLGDVEAGMQINLTKANIAVVGWTVTQPETRWVDPFVSLRGEKGDWQVILKDTESNVLTSIKRYKLLPNRDIRKSVIGGPFTFLQNVASKKTLALLDHEETLLIPGEE